MNFLQLPAYQPGSAINFQPLTDAFERARKNALADRQFGLEQQRFGLEQGRYDIAKRESDRTYQNALAQQKMRDELLANPEAYGLNRDPATLAAYRTATPEQVPGLIMQGRSVDLERQRTESQTKLAQAQAAASYGAEGRSTAMFPGQLEQQRAELQRTEAGTKLSKAQAEQFRLATPEARKQALIESGIDASTPAGQGFILNGTYAPPGPMDDLLRGIAKDARSPGGASPSAPAGQPAGQHVIPQSLDGGAATDPNLIRTQAAGGQQQQQPARPRFDTPIGPMTEDNAKRLAFGLAAGKLPEAGKMVLDDIQKQQLHKDAVNDLEKKHIATLDSLQMVRNVRASLDPQFLTVPITAQMWKAGFAEKFGTLTPETRGLLYRFTTFRRDAAQNINVAIKAASGATVTEQELRRNLAELPNAGTGIFDGDSPTQFQAKLDRAEDVLMLSAARAAYLRKNDFRGTIDQAASIVPIEHMRNLILQRANAIRGELRATSPNVSPTQIEQEVKGRIKQEFGI